MKYGRMRSYARTTAPWACDQLKKKIGNDLKYVKFMLVAWNQGDYDYDGMESMYMSREKKVSRHLYR